MVDLTVSRQALGEWWGGQKEIGSRSPPSVIPRAESRLIVESRSIERLNAGREKRHSSIMPDGEGIQRKRERLTAETHEYFWNICPEQTARWKQAMLTLPPAVCRETWLLNYRDWKLVTNRATLELSKANAGGMDGDVPVEELLDRALASRKHISEADGTMTRLLDELLRT
jgi:hypothetical protein